VYLIRLATLIWLHWNLGRWTTQVEEEEEEEEEVNETANFFSLIAYFKRSKMLSRYSRLFGGILVRDKGHSK